MESKSSFLFTGNKLKNSIQRVQKEKVVERKTVQLIDGDMCSVTHSQQRDSWRQRVIILGITGCLKHSQLLRRAA